ncbi:DNA-binding protein [Acinetobacter gandensis]|uniref:DNA replication protein n=1 Tax=Acinetobacter gandensis TaxID=1443941 RepID=A0A1A7RDA6_9GAMM|nr:plasmid replication DNA-binding protein [Acinetobacter gandensis]KAB0622357.1 DNA-binding protein [Acinetobacter gandensis]OBX29418.1 DNA replication protein [Acinetobacter gandensis]
MKTLTVLELSKLYNINRQTIYNNIKKGILSKNSDNKIDLAEAIRVFGEPIKKQDVKDPVKVDSPNSAEVLLLRQQIDILKNQLNDAKDRESFYQNQIETMQRLLEAPKPQKVEDPTPVAPPQETVEAPKEEAEIQTEIETPKKRIPVPEHVEPEPKKRGFLSRFFLPNG